MIASMVRAQRKKAIHQLDVEMTIQQQNRWESTHALIDSEAGVNCISQSLVQAMQLQGAANTIVSPTSISGEKMFCYEQHLIQLRLQDS